jgi:O-antigen/teichoic acid export membrane protein
MRVLLEDLAARLRLADLRPLGRDTLLLWGVQIYYRLSGVVVLMVLSRKLSSGDIGIYFFALSVAESLIVLANLSMDPVMMRRIASNPSQISKYVSPLLGFRIWSSPAYLLCVFLASFFLAGPILPAIMIVATATLAESLYLSLASMFVALNKAVYNFIIGVISQTIFLLVFLAGMWWTPSLGAFLGANLIRSFTLLCAGAILARRLFHSWRPTWNFAFLKEGAPFLLLTVIALMQERVDTLVLGWLAGFEAVAQYSLALRIISASTFIPSVMGTVFFPHIAADRIGNKSRSIIMRGAVLLAGIGLVAMTVGYIWAGPVTALLYGRLSSVVAGLLRPLTLLFPVQFLAFFLTTALQALRREKQALSAQAAGTAASVILNVILIPVFSIHGAITAKLLSSSLQLLLLAGYLWRFISLPAPRSQSVGQ